jgi:hypothetical protein
MRRQETNPAAPPPSTSSAGFDRDQYRDTAPRIETRMISIITMVSIALAALLGFAIRAQLNQCHGRQMRFVPVRRR